MSDHSTIEWTDATWNIITGCSVISPGCKNCYAMKLAGTRLRNHPSRVGLTQPSSAGPVWTGEVRFNEQWLGQPLSWNRPRRIFVCAHGDLFHEGVTDAQLDDVFAVMAEADWHTFQVLTKRIERARRYLSDPALPARVERAAVEAFNAWRIPRVLDDHAASWPLSNVWLGVSVEDQQRANERVPHLLSTPAAVRWISAEPLLGPVDLGFEFKTKRRIDWVVAGGESGQAARPMHPEWVRSLRDQCAETGVAFHFKQWGEWAPHQAVAGGDEGGDLRRGHVRYLQGDGREPDGHFRRGDAAVARIGKKAAGRKLDGRTHDEWPKATP